MGTMHFLLNLLASLMSRSCCDTLSPNKNFDTGVDLSQRFLYSEFNSGLISSRRNKLKSILALPYKARASVAFARIFCFSGPAFDIMQSFTSVVIADIALTIIIWTFCNFISLVLVASCPKSIC